MSNFFVIMFREVSTEAKKACSVFLQEPLEKQGNMARYSLREVSPVLDQTDTLEESEVQKGLL